MSEVSIRRVIARLLGRQRTVAPAPSKSAGAPGSRADVQTWVDARGRRFNYIHISRPESARLLIHFTAFFGDWGDRKEYRRYYQGYFHRLRMFEDVTDYGALFLCDEFGPTRNGTYYTGENGDLFVERAMTRIISGAFDRDGVDPSNVVTIGSSMGATGALKFGLMFNAGGIVAISPHIDLDVCAKLQGRMEHVNAIVPDGDPLSAENQRYTRQISRLVAERDTSELPLPRLFFHGCADDDGVYREQILPLTNAWRRKGGQVDLDIRPEGGHTSDFATESLLRDCIARIFERRPIEALEYRQNRLFWPEPKLQESAGGNEARDEVDARVAVDLISHFSTNAQMSQFLAVFAADRAMSRSGQLPLLAFQGAVDPAIAQAVKRHVNLEDVEVVSLVSSEDPAGPQTMIQESSGRSWAVAEENRPIVLCLNCSFYGLDRKRSLGLLAGLPAQVQWIVLTDQVDNWDGTASQVLKLCDSGGRAYEAECHDFQNMLRQVGFTAMVRQELPQPAKSVSGVIIAEKFPTAHGPPADTELGTAIEDFFRQQQTFDLRRFRGQQVGQFIIPSCSAGGLRIRALLRNCHREGEEIPIELRKLGMPVELRVFRAGRLIFHDPCFTRIPYNGLQEISENTCAALEGDQADLLIVARCFLPSDGATYFGQEHQLSYQHGETGGLCSILYDQLPVPIGERPYSPIVLLAPKVWVSTSVNTFVTFASTDSSLRERAQQRPMEITVLAPSGRQLAHRCVTLPVNSTFIFDVRNALADAVQIADEPQLFTVVAKGGASSFAIVTFVINERTGNCALEHSLSPHYYVSGDLLRVRDDSLESFNAPGHQDAGP